MTSITRLEGQSIHQIQSGQVIVDLCSIVKELVENSLDAGASSIEIRFKNHGLDAIEVQDNGTGIAEADHDTIALKHYTSKLSSFEELSNVSTFGFRGEAVSSLCAVCKVHIVTARAEEAPKGWKLDFETSGKLKDKSVTASQRGTTVTAENVFLNLPVRRRELQRNLKREYAKALALLQSYACISTNIRLSVSNQISKGKKVIAFSTKANDTTKDNIANVYGAKVLSSLLPLDFKLSIDPSSPRAEDRTTVDQDVRIRGHISRPTMHEGRQTPDRQMLFVNGRPCSLPQISKAINEVYRSFNQSQSPFILANIQMNTNDYDVNVSPDKRTILLHSQTTLINALKEDLAGIFEANNQMLMHIQASQKPSSVMQSKLFGSKLSSDSAVTFSDTIEDTLPHSDAQGSNTLSPDAFEEEAGDDSNANSDTTLCNYKGSLVTENSSLLSKGKRRLIAALDREKAGAASTLGVHVPSEASEDHFDTSTSAIATHTDGDLPDGIATHGNEASPRVLMSTNLQHANSLADSDSLFVQDRSPSPEGRSLPRRSRNDKGTAIVTIGQSTTVVPLQEERSIKRRRIHTKNNHLLLDNEQTTTFQGTLKGFAADEEAKISESMSESEESLLINTSGQDSNSNMSIHSDDEDDDLSTTEPPMDRWKKASADGEVGISVFVPQPDASLEGHGDVNPSVRPNELTSEDEVRRAEEERVSQLIDQAEESTKDPLRKSPQKIILVSEKRDAKRMSTLRLLYELDTSAVNLRSQCARLNGTLQDELSTRNLAESGARAADAEEKLSLTVIKSDFEKMRVIGQFNLGFIIAVRPARKQGINAEGQASNQSDSLDVDEVFIIDQHAADEKFNYERLQATTIVQSQRLVNAKTLELTAIEEETILEHGDALHRNGFELEMDTTGNMTVGQRARLISLPLSKEVTFKLSDLEELLVLLSDWQGIRDIEGNLVENSIRNMPRPGKVRKMFAMRACRSSTMIGKTLQSSQMDKIVKNLGTLDKPWNCPHGRPTMRHLTSLASWSPWREGDGIAMDEMNSPVHDAKSPSSLWSEYCDA